MSLTLPLQIFFFFRQPEHIKITFNWYMTIIMSFNRKAGSAENTLSQTDGKMQQSITLALVLAVFKALSP